jgi:hypothetical protein
MMEYIERGTHLLLLFQDIRTSYNPQPSRSADFGACTFSYVLSYN